jgi:Peptidase family M28
MMRRRLWTVGIVAILVVASASRRARAEGPPEMDLERLKAHVTTLASPEFGGRRGVGILKASQYLIQAFQELGLEPLFEGSFTQDIPARQEGLILGRNVGAKLVGSDPKLRDQWIILGAHYDHLGVRQDGALFPGADDNASGVAMMLEAARALAKGSERPKRSIMFLGFDLEESGLFGSRYFAEHSPVPLEQVALFLNADMIGRSLGGVCEPYVFVIGTERAPGLRPWVDQAAAGERDLRIGLLGTDMIGTRSDYGPFRSREVPYLFFSTGENPVYHTPQDTADTINYPKLQAISRVILGVLRQAVAADEVPKWSLEPDNPIAEAVTIRDVLRTLLDNRETLKVGPAQAILMKNALRNLDAIVKRGEMTPTERAGLVQVARLVLVSVL